MIARMSPCGSSIVGRSPEPVAVVHLLDGAVEVAEERSARPEAGAERRGDRGLIDLTERIRAKPP